MDFPVTEDTRDEFKNFVKVENQDHKINLPFPAGCTAGDMVVVEPWCGIADRTVAAAAGALAELHVREGIRVVSRQIETGAIFDTIGQDVWFNPVTGEYTDTEDDGLYLVGYVDEVTDADGCFAFEKKRYVEIGVGT
jgi:hypothetical protein